MSGLLGSLTAASRALEAQRFGLEVTGQNMANVNSPGYARREVQLSPSAVTDSLGAFGGVDIVGVRATRDRMLERRLQAEKPAEQRERAITDSMSLVEVAIGKPGASIDAQLDTFFDWASQLAADPVSNTLRHEFVSAGERLASAFREMAGRLQTAQRQADTGVRSSVDEANRVLAQIAKLNAAVAKAGPEKATSQALIDQQKVLLDQLTSIVDVDVIERADGGVDITTSSGRSLVIGDTATRIEITPALSTGYADLTLGGQSITADISGGKLGGYIHVRDTLLPGYLKDLDTLAAGLASAVNGLHAAGFDANGNAGGAFFTVAPGGSAASSIAVSAAISADTSRVAAAGTAVRGDNQNARALAALKDANVIDGASCSGAWAKLVYRVGSDAQAAQQELTSRQELVRQVEALYDAVSGVSLDEEAMTMLRFQRGYEANARFFQAIDQALETLFNMV